MLGIYRVAWLFGYRYHADGIAADRLRADQAAGWLQGVAADNNDVVLFGHGIMNHLIERSLQSKGWNKSESSGKGYWSMTRLHRIAGQEN